MRTGLVLLLALIAGLAAARPAPAADRFLVGGYCIGDAWGHPEWLVSIDAAGIDFVDNLDQHFDPYYGRQLVRQLDSLRVARPGFALRAVLNLSKSDPRHEAFSGGTDTSRATLERIARTLRPQGGLSGPSVLGWSLGDEPCTREQIARDGVVARYLRRRPETAGSIAMVNLHPLAGPGVSTCYEVEYLRGRERRAGYAAYLDTWLAQFDDEPDPAPSLMFDHYPFQWRGKAPTNFPENLAVASDRARAYGRPGRRVPLWVVVQAGRFRAKDEPYNDAPTPAHTRWQAWYAVAYGAKAIAYWTLFPTGWESGPRYDHGPFRPDGSRRPEWYDALRDLNARLHALGPTLVALDPVEVWRGRQGAPGGLAVDVDWGAAGFSRAVIEASLVTTGGGAKIDDLVVGQLRDGETGDDYLLVLNAHLESARSYRLRLAGKASRIERIDGTTGKAVLVARDTDLFAVPNLGPASAELFRVVDGLVETVPGVLEIREDGSRRWFRTALGILEVDASTGRRARADRMGGQPSTGLRAVANGVARAD